MIRQLALALLLGGTSILHAQATPTASRQGDLQIGAGYALAKPDYGQDTFRGFAAYVDFDFHPNFGIEAAFHQVHTSTNDQAYQRTYEIGGRYLRKYRAISPYAKAMIGRGTFNYPQGLTRLSYNMFALGAGADINLGPHLRVRGEYESQRWFNFPPDGLTPQLVTIGVAYHFTGKTRQK